MKVSCPVCGAEYDCPPGKYQCVCGATFFVAADGGVSCAGEFRGVSGDPDGTVPPQRRKETSPAETGDFDPDETIPGSRVRRARGELRTGDVVLDRYELLERLGSGAMGVVFKCKERVSGVEYALKMVPPELARDTTAMEDVRKNFRLVHSLKHPNIAGVDFLERDEYGAYFLIMEYARGESLARWIRRKWKEGRPELNEVVSIVRQIASALDYAHSQQVLHRDIKPANVMIDEKGNVKVLDFGLASKVRSTMSALSVDPANSSGTPNYLSPEQFKGKYPGPAADQYALGVLAYQMLAGHLPFEADDFEVLRSAVCNEAPDVIDGIPDAANKCLQKALSKDPKERYASCTAFAEALGSRTEDSAPGPRKAEVSSLSPPRSGKRLKKIIAVAAAVTVVLAAAAAVTFFTNRISQKNLTLELPGGVKLEMVRIKAGTFMMGSPGVELGYGGEKLRRVTLTKDYWMGKYEVTQGQWKSVMGYNPSEFQKGDDYPADSTMWSHARRLCDTLNKLLADKLPRGYHFDLPTPAQWEYACRAGTTTALNSGKNLTSEKGVCPNLDEVGWYDKNSRRSTHPVGKKRPNAWGLYDMHGNVWEWCYDPREKNDIYEGVSRRGGGWTCYAKTCRSALSHTPQRMRNDDCGFRLALVPIK